MISGACFRFPANDRLLAGNLLHLIHYLNLIRHSLLVGAPSRVHPIRTTEKYGFDPAAAQTQILQTGIIYQATANGNCAFGEVFTTDGRIKALDLIVLEDDKQFFPHYNAAVTTPKDVADRFPSIAKVTAPVMAALTSEAITELNRQVDVDGKEPADVARDWLVSKGFVNY